MPIYECNCVTCDLTFEVLASVAQANRRRPCPECGKPAPRIASAFAIVSGGAPVTEAKTKNGAKKPAAGRQRTGPPLCLQNPHIPLLCHMDEPSARRWVAHFNGRGAEYDDKAAKRAELQKKRGLPPPPEPTLSGHVHAHDHEHNPRRHSIGSVTAPSADRAHPHHDAHSHSDGHVHSPSRSNGAQSHLRDNSHTLSQ
jgi:putative FmdB family regulatory protein